MPQLMDNLHRLLEEAKVNDYVLYHTLSSYKALKIMSTDTLVLPLSDTNKNEQNPLHKKIKTYYLSFARTPSSGYIAGRSPGLRKVQETTLLVFDRHKLKNLRGVTFSSVDYWGVNSTGRAMGGSKEAEDRMFSDSQKIKGILSCIKEVRIYLPYEMETDYLSQTKTKKVGKVHVTDYQLYSFCKKKKIPIKLFTSDNFAGYLIGQEKKTDAHLVHEAMKSAATSKTPDYRERNRDKPYEKLYGKTRIRFPDNLLELAQKDHLSQLSKDVRSLVLDTFHYANLTDKGYGEPSGYSLEYMQRSEIHNMRGSPEERPKRMFARCLTLMKASNVKQLYEKLFDKWKTIIERELK